MRFKRIIVLSAGLGLAWFFWSNGLWGVQPSASQGAVAVPAFVGCGTEAETVAAMAALEAVRSRFGIGSSSTANVPVVVTSLSASSWMKGEKVNAHNLVFSVRQGVIPVKLLWRHKDLNPSDRAPSSEEREELGRLATALELAMAPVASKWRERERAHRLAMIESGAVREYSGEFVASQVTIDGKTYLATDFPVSQEVESLREYVKFIAAESLSTVIGYFVSRGFTTWTPQTEGWMVKAMM